MKKTKTWTAIALPLLVASAVLTAAPSAGAASAGTLATSGGVSTQATLTCKGYGKAGVTNARTPVHTGPSGSATVTGYIAAGRTTHLYYECINSAGNLWYEITGYLDSDAPGTPNRARFIYSGYLK
ncbi:SH3 domain-containing protein [Streptomyces sp. NPDC102451]|uniref:SH3 domain-containing protein n=1 Tax=Streptomyces sp. NPDC102451 TaxID=3366177 RepID=UPI0038041DFF